MTAEQKNFIEMIGNAAVSYYKTYGILAYYVKDIIFTAQTVERISDKEYWAKTPSGYVCIQNKDGIYAKKK